MGQTDSYQRASLMTNHLNELQRRDNNYTVKAY